MCIAPEQPLRDAEHAARHFAARIALVARHGSRECRELIQPLAGQRGARAASAMTAA